MSNMKTKLQLQPLPPLHPLTQSRKQIVIRQLHGGQKLCPHCGHIVESLSHTKLRKIRQELKLSLREVAGNAGLSAPYISDIELGRRGLSVELANRLLRAMGI